jgi:hypothetical protein
VQTGSKEGNHNEGTKKKCNICYLEMLGEKKKMCAYAKKVFAVCVKITDLE